MMIFLATYAYSLIVDALKSLLELFVIRNWVPQETLQLLDPEEACIIIPCHNSEATIIGTLEKLPSKYQVYLVANGCTDNTEKILADYCAKNPKAKLISTPEPGKMFSVYMAALKAKQEKFTHFMLLDDDVRLMGLKGDYYLFVNDKSVPCTALPVIPTTPMNTLEVMQHMEYEYMCASKQAQRLMPFWQSDVIMASGAGAIYRVDKFLEVALDHDGEHCGDDWMLSALYHVKGLRIDFLPEYVVETVPPATLKEWWKQRAGRWELSQIKNWRLALQIMFGLRSRLYTRVIVLYRWAAQVNDVLRLISAPFALYYYPEYFVGLLAISYLCMMLKAQAYSHVFFGRPKRFNVLFPLYTQLMWISRLCALPKAITLAFKKYPKLGESL